MNNTNDKEQKKEVQKSNDEHIDQDFPGYPNPPAKENIINPKSEKNKKTADVHVHENPETDGTYPESSDSSNKKNEETKEIKSDGSAGAFGGTEEVSE